MRSDDPARARGLLEARGLSALEGVADQDDFGLDFGLAQRARRPVLALWWGERVMVRTRSPERLADAFVTWVDGLVADRPSGHLVLLDSTAMLVDDQLMLVPSFAVKDSAQLERLVPKGTRFVDVPRLFLDPSTSRVTAPSGAELGVPAGMALIRHGDMAVADTPARRVVLLRASTGGREDPEIYLDGLCHLASTPSRWTVVGSQDDALTTAKTIVTDLILR